MAIHYSLFSQQCPLVVFHNTILTAASSQITLMRCNVDAETLQLLHCVIYG